jgi:hypothetical protein
VIPEGRIVPEEGSIDVAAFTPVWSLGWQWPWAVLLAAMIGANFLLAADRLVLGTAVLIVGPGVAVAGVRAVNRHSADALADGSKRARRAVAAELDRDDASTSYSLAEGSDSAYGLDCSKQYDLTVVTLGETELTIHHDITVNLLDTTWTVGDRTEQIPYDHVESVSHQDGILRMELADEEPKSLTTEDRPVELLAAFERQLENSDTAG